MERINRFNIRVYAIVINRFNQVLLSKEHIRGNDYIKFPGGGLEFGEGIADALRRELREELNADILHSEHFYTTDFFQQSAFLPTDQIISVYYKVSVPDADALSLENPDDDALQGFFWVPIPDLLPEHVTLPIDKLVVQKLRDTV